MSSDPSAPIIVPSEPPPSPSASSPKQPLPATLPPELLLQIFSATKDLISGPSNQQRERLRQGLVCRSWYAARLKPDEYLVQGPEQTDALRAVLERDPARARAATKVEIDQGGQGARGLLDLCTGLTDVVLVNEGEIDVDVLSALSATVKTITLVLDQRAQGNWLPDLSSIAPKIKIDLTLLYENQEETFDKSKSISALSDVASQVTHLALLDTSAEDTDSSILEAVLPRMSRLGSLEINMWECDPQKLPQLVGSLPLLETLKIGAADGEPHRKFTPRLVMETLEVTAEVFKRFTVDGAVMHSHNWTTQSRRTVEREMEKRGVKFVVEE